MNDPKRQRSRSFGGRGVVLVFSLCALADFAWSLFDGRSVAESVISAALGLFGTGWCLLAMWASSQNDPDDPNEPARWVP
ncbi:MAG TPA: hypothetical protein VEK33_24945 [Terriglobales bacterium]|nr:hypothetical protein [Terriglobales bacterium]